ncbi:MAG: VIT domain-containing protein, partial [bacterium]
MKKQLIFVGISVLLNFSVIALADGIIVPPPGVNLSVKYHHVSVDIKDQVALTEIDQVFLNDTAVDSVEGLYIFPLPKDASFSSFSMFVDGEELQAKVYDADSARVIYESIVRRNLDPALLEYIGRGLFQARVYPILAHGEKRIKISYSELLNYDSELYRYVYPLSTEKFSAKPLEDVSVTVTLTASNPIKTIYSPSHPIVVQKSDDYHA